jgi:DNA-directed RNA polymerase specialized sigma24 family protein
MSMQEWQKLAAQEARRRTRAGWTPLDEDDLIQEALIAVWAHVRKGGPDDGALLRIIARRRISVVLRLGRRRSWTCRIPVTTQTDRSRHRRVKARGHLFASEGFLAFGEGDEDSGGPPIQAFDPTAEIEVALSYQQVRGRFEVETARSLKSAGKSRQARHQLEQRMLKWCRTNARPFDPGFVDATSAVAQ